MNAKKITAIVLLVLFVLSLPLSLAVTDFGSILFNQGKVTGLIVNNLVSDQALPLGQGQARQHHQLHLRQPW